MPKRTDISTILIIGAGPIVIGQACEFDYSGTQAVKTLKEEGYRIVLVNSNPATIMLKDPAKPVLLPLLNGGTAAILFCFACLYLATAGGGPYSVDEMRKR